MHGIWFNTRHASTRPNAQLLLADELPLLCACAVRPLTEIYDCSIGPRIARIAVNWISVSFELRHYERGIFFVFSSTSLHSFADHSRVHALTDFGCVAINAQRTLLSTRIYLSVSSAVRQFRAESILSSTVSYIRNVSAFGRSLKWNDSNALNTFDVNLISGPLTERTNFGRKRKQ